jgi:Flp pilus assembly pilin Flp
MTLLLRLVRESDGEDLIEYALITTFIGLVGFAAWAAMQTSIGTIYSSYVTAAWALWDPPNPGGT